MADPAGWNDARYRKVFAPYIPVEAGGLMPAGQRDAMRDAMARVLAAQPPSRNIEDRTKEGQVGEFLANALDPRRWLYRTQMQPEPTVPPEPGRLGAEAGYWDIPDPDKRPRVPR